MKPLLPLFGILLAAAAPSAQTCTTSWAAPVNGTWSNAANWTAGVPGVTDVACIVLDGTYTVNAEQTDRIFAGLVLGGASGAQTLSSASVMRVMGDARVGANAIWDIQNRPSTVTDGANVDGTLLVEGIVQQVAGTAMLPAGGTLDVAPGGKWLISGASSIGFQSPATYRLRGTLEASGTEAKRLRAPLLVEGGTVRVLGGSLELSGGTLRDANLDVPAGSQLVLATGPNGYEVTGTLSGTPSGTVRLSSARFAAGLGGATLAVGGSGLTVLSASGVSFSRIESAGGDFVNTGLLISENLGGGVYGTVSIENQGVLRLLLGLSLRDEGSVVRNTPSGRIEMFSSQGSQFFGAGQLINEGLIETQTVNGASFASGLLHSQPGSEIRLLAGRLDLVSPASETFPASTLVTGSGNFRLPLDFEGTFSPGSVAEPFATVDLGAFFRPAPTGHLVIDVGNGGASDTLVRLPSVGTRLGGTLVLRLEEGYTPAIGDVFEVFSFNTGLGFSGAFAAVDIGGTLPAGLGFAVIQPPPGQTGTVTARVVAVSSIETLANSTSEDGAPVTVIVRTPATDTGSTALLAFEGSVRRFDDFVTDISGSAVRIPAGATEARFTIFPLRDALAEGTETLTVRLLPGGTVIPGAENQVSISLTDAPSTNELSVDAIAPSAGANVGTVTATILGQALEAGASVRLVKGGFSVDGAFVEPGANGNGISAVFDLAGAPLGVYDVVVSSVGSTETLAGGFTVEELRNVNIWADVVGTSSPRIGRWSTYTMNIGNTGNTDIHDVALVVRVTNGLDVEFMEGVLDLFDAPAAEQDIRLDAIDQAQVYPLWFRTLPAGYTGTFRIRVLPRIGIIEQGDGIGVSYELYPPDPDSLFTFSGDFDDGPGYNYALMWGALGAYDVAYPETLNGGAAPWAATTSEPYVKALDEDDDRNNDWSPRDQPPLIQDVSDADLTALYDQGHRFNSYYQPNIQNGGNGSSGFGGFSTKSLLGPATGARSSPANVIIGGISAMVFIRSAGKKSQQILSERCWVPPCGGGNGGGGAGSGGFGVDPNTGSGTGGAGGKGGASRDPNDKHGPAGVGSQRFIRTDEPARYTIRFENLETVAFPAQEVVITDTLDANVFDLTTFSLGPIAFGDRLITPPPGLKTFTTEVDLAPLSASLLVNARIEVSTGRATWSFSTLDPTTRDLPEDGLIGFLPPNVTSPEGEGSVSYTVGILPDLPNGTALRNQASIVFDIHDPIVTPVWTNTVDDLAPVTSVNSLPPSSTSPVAIAVTGSDPGAGLDQYAVFVSADGGPFGLYAVADSSTFSFEGEVGLTYSFFSVGMDYAMNVEGPKKEAETSTTVMLVAEEGGPTLPTELMLAAPFPNPVRSMATVRVGLPQAQHVDVRVFDLLGREVARIADEDRAAGWHTLAMDPLALASGSYVLRAQTEDSIRTQRFTVLR